jgi:hypothetical protein
MQFNESTATLSFEALLLVLNIGEEILKRVLHSLVCGKYRLLKKVGGEGASIRNTDSFMINEHFT